MSDIQSNSGSTDGPNGGHNECEDKDMSPMIGLNEDVLIEIFSHLSLKERMSLRRVCNQWKGFIDSSFKSQKVLNLSSIGSQVMSEKVICLLIRKCCYVKHISFKDMFVFFSRKTSLAERKTTDNVVVNIVSNCESLESIDFADLDDFNEDFETNFNYFRRLKKFSSKYMSEKALNLIIDSQNLKTIDIRGNQEISKPEFKRLGKGIKELELIDSFIDNEKAVKEICCGNGVNITNLSIDIKDTNVLTIICKHLKQLKTFKFKVFSEEIDIKHFSNLKHLKSLEIHFNNKVSLNSEDFMNLFRSLKNINLIDLKLNFWSFTDPMFDNKALQELQQNCSLIETLVIRGANRISGTGMQSVAQMKNIKYLDLGNCKNITDEIEIVITSCPLLRELILHKCSEICESVVKTFIQKSKSLPKESFYLDVIDTNISEESMNTLKPPKNLRISCKCEIISRRLRFRNRFFRFC